MFKMIKNMFHGKKKEDNKLTIKKRVKINDLVNKFSGKRILQLLAPNDEPLWESCLHKTQLVIIGGFDGTAIKRALIDVPKIKNIHVYEPVKKFYKKIKDIDKKVKVFNEAVWTKKGSVEINVANDHSFIRSVNRLKVKKIETVEVVSTVNASHVVKRLNRKDFLPFLNCEGAEYSIIKSFLKLKHKPKTIIFQSHEVQDSLLKLIGLRLLLAKSDYIPVLCHDYAWDIWVQKSLI